MRAHFEMTPFSSSVFSLRRLPPYVENLLLTNNAAIMSKYDLNLKDSMGVCLLHAAPGPVYIAVGHTQHSQNLSD